MSSDDDTAAIIAEFDALYIAGVCSIAVSVIIMYEYLITIGKEVRLFWGKKITGAAVLFFSNRYLVLVFNIDILVNSNIRVSDAIAQYIPWAAFTGLRAFALCRNWFLSLLAFALSMVSVVVNLVDYAFGVSGEADGSLLTCISVEGITLDLAKKCTQITDTAEYVMTLTVCVHCWPVTILSRTCLISADVILIGITWSRLSRRGLRHVESTNLFTEVLLRDGTLYFVTLLIMNSLHLTLSLLAIAGVPLQAVSLIPLFTEPLTANLISRFLLHLQSVNQKVTGEDFETTQGGSGDHAESLVFQRVVGSIGSSIDPMASLAEDNDEGEGTVEGTGGARTSDYELSPRSALPDSEATKDIPEGIVEMKSSGQESDGINALLV